jgi:hypothetical protein
VSERHVESKFEGPKFRIISWPAVAVALVIIAGGTAALMVWLLRVAGADPGRQLDAVKTAFTVGLAAGGTLALLLATRRQWLQERERIHTEFVAADTADRAERVAAATERDATERRMTELYVKASDQLGSEKAAVRLAGLFALERLGQNNPGQRKVVVKVITSYLRMPLPRVRAGEESDDGPAPKTADSVEMIQEVEVRKAAQQIIADHLGSDRVADSRWQEIDFIDLSGAHLFDFSLSDCHVRSIQMNGAVFEGETLFRNFHCTLMFAASTVFKGFADFRGAVFEGHAWISWAKFEGGARFNSDDFFAGAQFKQFVSFQHTRFAERTDFSGARFSAGVNFSGAEFNGDPRAIGLGDAVVEDPDARSPEVGSAPSVWPEGWTVKSRSDGSAHLIQKRIRAGRNRNSGPPESAGKSA